MDYPANKNYLFELKRIDWDFARENGTSGLAAYHWYPARYVSQLAGILINYFSKPGDVVLDPFCGSGTTLMESFKFGRLGMGVELNPIGVLITKAKLIPFDEQSLSNYTDVLLKETNSLLIHYKSLQLDPVRFGQIMPNYKENSFWYHSETLAELASIWTAVNQLSNLSYFNLGLATFSSILRYCCSQNKHWGWICDNVKPKSLVYMNAIKKFSEKLAEYRSGMNKLLDEVSELQEKQTPVSDIRVFEGDCIEVLTGFPEETVDLVVTSPPYYNMTDYIPSQRLSSLWLNYSIETLRAREVGARYKRFRANSLKEYLDDMKRCFLEIARVLRTGSMCCVVIGESPRHQPFLAQFKEILHELNFDLEESISRRVRKQRSLSPILHQEEILILRKV